MKAKHISTLLLALASCLNLWASKEDDAIAARELVDNGPEAVAEWAMVRIPAASIRTSGRHAAEMSTQAIMGTPLSVLEKESDWWKIQTPDGYTGWIPTSSIVTKTAPEMAAWRAAKRVVVVSPWQVRVYADPAMEGATEGIVTDLVNGSVVEADAAASTPTHTAVVLPDGRRGYILDEYVTDFGKWADQEFSPKLILSIASSMEGTPYLWGGTSTKALDCSGLAKVSYLANGRILMRDASQQAVTGKHIEPENWRACRPGDLLFFGTRSGKVTHVAIYDHDGKYIHSSGRVKRNSIDPAHNDYLSTPFLGAVRIDGNEGTPGITKVADHTWYVNKNK